VLPKVSLPLIQKVLDAALAHLLILKLIHDFPGISRGKLRKMVLEYGYSQRVQRIVALLKLRGLVKEKKLHREKKLYLTPKGEKVFQECLGFLEEALKLVKYG